MQASESGRVTASSGFLSGTSRSRRNREIRRDRTLVEVRYLYAYPGGALYQPVYLGPRTDQTLPDDVSTLKFKQGTDDDDPLN